MSAIHIIKFVIQSISYGIFIGVVLLLLVPNLTPTQFSLAQIFQQTPQNAAPLSYASAVAKASPAVVNIYSSEIQSTPTYGQLNRQSTRLGSGVIMKADGYILTNFHVVENSDLIEVWLQNGQKYPAELIGYDTYTDLAVLKVNAINLPVILQNPKISSLPGDVVLAIGNPLNLGQTITQGIISAIGRKSLSNSIGNSSYLEFLQMDAAINDGNSGGALVNTLGELVGINSRRLVQSDPQQDIQGIFFAVPYHLANRVLQQIIENGRVVRGWLGISATAYIDTLNGVLIESVNLHGPAKKAGLRSGDIIYQIAGNKVKSINHALDLIAQTKPNTRLPLKIYRGNQQFDVLVTIEAFRQ